jgi:hypothetical protein
VNDADLAILKAERLRAEIRYESRRFILEILFALVVVFALGWALGRFWR